MKIAIVTESVFPDQLGGIQKYSTELARSFALQGHSVLLLHLLPAPSCAEELQGLGIEFKHIPVQGKGISIWKYLNTNKQFSTAALAAAQQWGAEIAYAQGFTGFSEATLNTGNMKVVHNFHGLEMFQPVRGIKARIIALIFRRTVKDILRRARYAVALGKPLSGIMLKENPQLICEIIPNAVSKQWLTTVTRTHTESRKYLYVGRYEWRKGIHVLHAAIQRFLKHPMSEKAQFTFVGNIPQEVRLDHPQIHYTGPVYDEEKLKEYFAQHDILVNASFSEGMPTVVLEAMAMGMAVIATDCGATADLVSDANGKLIPPFDVVALEAAIREGYALSAENLARMGEISQEMVKNTFNWEQIADKHLGFFKKICN